MCFIIHVHSLLLDGQPKVQPAGERVSEHHMISFPESVFMQQISHLKM